MDIGVSSWWCVSITFVFHYQFEHLITAFLRSLPSSHTYLLFLPCSFSLIVHDSHPYKPHSVQNILWDFSGPRSYHPLLFHEGHFCKSYSRFNTNSRSSMLWNCTTQVLESPELPLLYPSQSDIHHCCGVSHYHYFSLLYINFYVKLV